MSRRRVLVSMVVMGALMLPATLSFAQEQPAQGQGQERREGERRGDGQRGGGDRGNWQERMAGFMKEQLAVNDEEWKVLQPKLQKVMEARRDTGAFGSGFFGGRGGRDGGGSDQPQSAAVKASSDLRQTLDNKEAKPEEIAAKLKALREAREKAKADLAV